MAEALIEALGSLPLEGRPVLIARAAEARDVLPEALRERGAKVDVVAFYETVREQLERRRDRAGAASADYVTFTSSSTVRNLLDGDGRRRLPGPGPDRLDRPDHQRDARELGLTVDVEADPHTPEGLVAALVADASGA